MLVLLLARLPNGRMPKGARSLEVQEVWETPGAGDEDHGRKCEQFFYCITVKRHTNERCRSDDRERDVHGHAARRRGEKHLTVREKSQISQAHAQTKPSPLSTHAFLHRQHVAKARPALQSADLLEVRRAERVLSAAKSH